MAYFTIPYQIHFEDTMAYESHHYLTNFRFQCAVREALYFSPGPDGQDLWREDLDRLVILTYEGYSRNLAPLRLGDRLTLFLTVGEVGGSSLQLCFRAVSETGTPVAVGYQRILCIGRDSREIVPTPRSMTQYFGHIDEPLTGTLFEELAHKGGRALDRIFTPEVRELARAVATARDQNARFIDGAGRQHLIPPTAPYAAPVGRTALLLPGQGSYDWASLRSLYHQFPVTRAAFAAADAATRTHFGQPFLPLVLADSVAEHDQLLARFPDLDQLGIYLLGVLTTRLLHEHGISFDLVAGHSFGEVVALAAAGAVSIEVGLQLVSQRILALQTVGAGCGTMMALGCDPARARALLAELAPPGPVVAVHNHPQQTVVAGPRLAIDQLAQSLGAAGVTATLLQSRYPFHSAWLAPAVGAFAVGIADLASQQASVAPIFSPADGRIHRRGDEILARLPLDLVRPLHFHQALQTLYAQGVRTFIQGGHGSALAKIVHRSLAGKDELVVRHCLGKGMTLAQGIAALARQTTAAAPRSRPEPPPPPSAEARPAPVAAPPHLDRTILAPLVAPAETPRVEPVAIVAAGCVLPGASDVAALWRNVLSGLSGIVDFGQLDPEARADFFASGAIQPDKTYSLLVGAVPPVDATVTARLPYSAAELVDLGLPEKLLAVALAEALAALPKTAAGSSPARISYVLGATADGSVKQDLAQVVASVTDITAGAAAVSAASRAAFSQAASRLLGLPGATAGPVNQHEAYAAVFRRLLGPHVSGYVVDTACSSSLYALALGMRALAERTCDVAVAGGVYEVTMGNSCLFSQFGGLSATGSRSLDASADGVVFGSGAAVLVLKRLSDAIAAGDRVLGVVRGVGLSSDGKSPAVNVPQSEGQLLAMQRAYSAAGLSPQSIALVEAHATATLVGDATELRSLNQMYAGGHGIELRSLKSLIGHTGWAAGIASVIVLCQALTERVIPPQHGFRTPNPAIELATSPFVIATTPKPWPERPDGLPRRAAADGFGFGGTNAHVIVESYVPEFHRQLAVAPARAVTTLAVLGVGCLFPGADGAPQSVPPASGCGGLRFADDRFGLPVGRRVLPDVLAAMDGSQRLALLAAQDALQPILSAGVALARQTGIVLGLAGKTARGIAVTERIFRDRLVRRFHNAPGASGSDASQQALLLRVSEQLLARNPPTGPYTLSGAMPNVAAGRVANFFNLKGPNLVVDAASDSLLQAVYTAAQLLGGSDGEFMLAGAVNALAEPLTTRSPRDGQEAQVAVGEAIILLAVARPETAAQHGLRPLALLELAPAPTPPAGAVTPALVDYRGATGAAELARAIAAAEVMGAATVLRSRLPSSPAGRAVRVVGTGRSAPAQATRGPDLAQPLAESRSAAHKPPDPAADSPVRRFAPTLVQSAAPAGTLPAALHQRRVLFVCDQPDWLAAAGAQALSGLTYRIACRQSQGRTHCIAIDTASEETLRATLQGLREFAYDTVIAVKNLADAPLDDLLEHGWDASYLTLLFAVTRHVYDELAAGQLALALLVVGGVRPPGILHPQTGLLSGYLKSLSRELPQATCRIVQTDQPDLGAALAEVAGELTLAGGPPVEICFRGGRRHEVRLAPLDSPVPAPAPLLSADSLVLLTGGARGVTAILAEALLERFGCRVVLLGRSAPHLVDPKLLALTDEEFAAREAEFLSQAQAAGTRVGAARQRHQTILAARETLKTCARLQSLPGLVEYHAVDVTSPERVEQIIKSVVQRLGPVDLVVHGAGVQHSKRLPRRKLAELQQTIDTKLLGLRNLYTALRRHCPVGRPVHFHLLTSAFSVLGNDGQHDYGAANEAMNRLAAAMAGGGDTWTALGWLGWDRIGMTRGSEYALLQEERGLHGITAEEGKELFISTISGAPPPPVTVLLGPGERRFYQVADAVLPVEPPAEQVTAAAGWQWQLGLETHPFIGAHQVRGKPTLPGTFELELAARTVKRLHPELHLVGFQSCRFTRFVPVRKGRSAVLRCETRLVQETRSITRLQLRLISDLLHPSGRLLQSAVLHMECEVLLSRATPGPLRGRLDFQSPQHGTAVSDPYTDARAVVFHTAPFDTLRQTVHGSQQNRSRFHGPAADQLAQLSECITPFLLCDAAFKVAQLNILPDGSMPVCVIAELASVYFAPGLTDAAVTALPEVVLCSTLPQPRGELLLVERVEARDGAGVVLAIAEGLLAQPVGRVPAQPAGGQFT